MHHGLHAYVCHMYHMHMRTRTRTHMHMLMLMRMHMHATQYRGHVHVPYDYGAGRCLMIIVQVSGALWCRCPMMQVHFDARTKRELRLRVADRVVCVDGTPLNGQVGSTAACVYNFASD